MFLAMGLPVSIPKGIPKAWVAIKRRVTTRRVPVSNRLLPAYHDHRMGLPTYKDGFVLRVYLFIFHYVREIS